MRNKFWTSEKLLSLSAIIVGLGTLIVFVYQTNLIREQQHMSVYPHLSVHYSQDKEEFKYVIVNKGIGPAIIKSVIISDNSSKEFNDFIDYYKYLFKENNFNFKYSYSGLSEGSLISEKEKIDLISVKNYDLKELQRLFKISTAKETKFEIIYESIYGERWKLLNDKNMPIKIEE